MPNRLLGLLADGLQGASNAAASNVSAPVDMLAWALRKAGVPVGDAPIGGSDWMAQKGLTRQPENRIAGLLGESVGGVAPLLAAAKAPQIASGLLTMGENMAQRATMNPQAGAIVWHGSPHKFDKFDSSKIGTGEGAQAYGHGLYLAESPDVAEQYRKALSTYETTLNGVPLTPAHPQFDAGMQVAARGYDKALADAQAAQAAGFFDPAYAQRQVDAIQALKGAVIKQNQKGSIYKVDLPDEHIAKMLDWDKPLSQQAPEVQRMLEPLGYSTKAQVSQFDDDLLAALNGDSSAPLQQIRDPMGADIARGGGVFDGPAQVVKAKRLQELGIPGIRYLDGGSRGTGTGTSNFVVFPGNEGLLSILERNGKPIK